MSGERPLRTWTFVVEGVPRTKRGAARGAHGQMHAARPSVDYEQRVAGAASAAGLAVGRGPCAVAVDLYLPTKRVKDADRVLSAIFDGMKRAGTHALADDSLMVVQDVRVVLAGIDPLRPRAVVVVTEIEGMCLEPARSVLRGVGDDQTMPVCGLDGGE